MLICVATQAVCFYSDTQSPRFSSCPYDQWAKDNEIVRWVPPVPTDNVGIYRLAVSGDDHLNKTLKAGAYAVSYTALDYDMNQAICSFIINVFETSKWLFKPMWFIPPCIPLLDSKTRVYRGKQFFSLILL